MTKKQQEKILQDWIADFEDTYGRKPNPQTIFKWKMEISEMTEHEEDYGEN